MKDSQNWINYLLRKWYKMEILVTSPKFHKVSIVGMQWNLYISGEVV